MLLTFLLSAIASPVDPPTLTTGRLLTPPSSFVDTSKTCPRPQLRMAEEPKRIGPQRLIDLPPGRLELTVMRMVDGCLIPAVVREGIGAAPSGEDGAASR